MLSEIVLISKGIFMLSDSPPHTNTKIITIPIKIFIAEHVLAWGVTFTYNYPPMSDNVSAIA